MENLIFVFILKIFNVKNTVTILNSCPVCRHVINPDVDIVTDPFMRTLLAEIRLKCPENGCDQIIPYDYGFYNIGTTL